MAKKMTDYAVIVLIAVLFGLGIPVSGMALLKIMTVEARADKTLDEVKIQQQKLEKLLEEINGRRP